MISTGFAQQCATYVMVWEIELPGSVTQWVFVLKAQADAGISGNVASMHLAIFGMFAGDGT
jgi:hypothetical protein